MRGLKVLLGTTALLGSLALVPKANAQVTVNIGVPPVCSYGYYNYAPYACAPVGFYGPGYFYNGIFLGMGPWAGWGYNHGWGSHRFSSSGGGRYNGGSGFEAERGRAGGPSVVRANSSYRSNAGASTSGSHAVAVRGSAYHVAPHTAAPRGGVSHVASHTAAPPPGATHGASHVAAAHDSAAHGAGGESHGGGGSHEGGEHH
jgi:hypothetical protein